MDFLSDFDAESSESVFQPSQSQNQRDVVRWQSSQTCAALESLLTDSRNAVKTKNRAGSSRGNTTASSSHFSTEASSSSIYFEGPSTTSSTNTSFGSTTSSRRSRSNALASSSRINNAPVAPPAIDERSIDCLNQLIQQVRTRMDKDMESNSSGTRQPLKRAHSGTISRTGRATVEKGIVKKKPTSRSEALARKVRVRGSEQAKGKEREVSGEWATVSDSGHASDASFMDVDSDSSYLEMTKDPTSLAGPSSIIRPSATGMMPPPALPPEPTRLRSSSAEAQDRSLVSSRARPTSLAQTTHLTESPAPELKDPVRSQRSFTKSLSASNAAAAQSSVGASYVASSKPVSAPAPGTRRSSNPPLRGPSTSPYNSCTSTSTSASSSVVAAAAPPAPIAASSFAPRASQAPLASQHAVTAAPRPSQSTVPRAGPPALGMRRAHTFSSTSSQSVFQPGSQLSKGLPTKQRGFKPPLLNRPLPPAPAPAANGSGMSIGGGGGGGGGQLGVVVPVARSLSASTVPMQVRDVDAANSGSYRHTSCPTAVGAAGNGVTRGVNSSSSVGSIRSFSSASPCSSSSGSSGFSAGSKPSSQTSHTNSASSSNTSCAVTSALRNAASSKSSVTSSKERPQTTVVKPKNSNSNSTSGERQDLPGYRSAAAVENDDDDVMMLEDDPNDSSYGDIDLSFDMDALEETMKMYD